MTENMPQKSTASPTQDAFSHSRDLLLALSRAAQSVQQARTEEQVYRAVGDQIKSLGEEVSLLIFNDDHESLNLAHTSYKPVLLRYIEKILGNPVIGHRVIFPTDSIYARSLRDGRAEYIHWTIEHIASVLPLALRPHAGQFMRLLKIKQGILHPCAPMMECWG